MYQLIKCVLSIGAGLAPDHRACGIFNGFAIAVNTFSIAFHVALLKISGKTVHVSAEAQAVRRRGVRIAEEHLRLRPDDARALYMGANGLVALGEIARGLEWADRALALDPEDAMLLYNIGCIRAMAGAADGALDCLERSVRGGHAQPGLARARQQPRLGPLRPALRGLDAQPRAGAGGGAVRKDPRPGNDRLISGKLRAKAGRSGAANTSVTVDGVDYAWSYRHGWVVWGKGFKVVSISVSLHPERTRELILDFTLKVNDGDGTPSDARVLERPGVRNSIGAGGRLGPGVPRPRVPPRDRRDVPRREAAMKDEGDVYRRLQQRLDELPVGYPATRVGRRAADPEAAVHAGGGRGGARPQRRPRDRREDPAAACPAARTEELERMLDRMVEKGAIFGGRMLARGGAKRYSRAPLVIGMYEAQVDRLTKELQQDFEQYAREGFATTLLGAKTKQMRTVPVNARFVPDRLVGRYDDARRLVEEGEGPWAARNCVCRQGKDLLGEPCRQTIARAGSASRSAAPRGPRSPRATARP